MKKRTELINDVAYVTIIILMEIFLLILFILFVRTRINMESMTNNELYASIVLTFMIAIVVFYFMPDIIFRTIEDIKKNKLGEKDKK